MRKPPNGMVTMPDGYLIRYTYGDFYRHDAIRSSRVTVENGEMVINDIAQ